MLIITILSILGVTALAAVIRKLVGFKICPICAGVASTWAWQLAVWRWGYEVDPIIIGMLMGASVVGAAYQLEKHFPANGLLMFWKTVFVSAGFVAVYGALKGEWIWLAGGLGAMVTLSVACFGWPRFPKHEKREVVSEKVEDLEKEMEECC